MVTGRSKIDSDFESFVIENFDGDDIKKIIMMYLSLYFEYMQEDSIFQAVNLLEDYYLSCKK